MTVSVQLFQNISEVNCPQIFSSLSKLVRVTALVLKFIQRLKRKIETTDISMEDQNIATSLWYKDIQTKLEEKEKSREEYRTLQFRTQQSIPFCYLEGSISKCVPCKKLQGRAYSSPPIPPLPAFRV